MTQEIIQRVYQEAITEHIPIMHAEGLLYCIDLIQQHQYNAILEVGTAIGHWSLSIAHQFSNVRIDSIEKDASRYHRAMLNVDEAQLTHQIHLIHQDVQEFTPSKVYDLIFLDGPKSQHRVLFEKFLPYLSPAGCFIIDNMGFHDLVQHKEAYVDRRNLHGLLRKIDAFKVWILSHPSTICQELDIGDGLLVVFRKYKD